MKCFKPEATLSCNIQITDSLKNYLGFLKVALLWEDLHLKCWEMQSSIGMCSREKSFGKENEISSQFLQRGDWKCVRISTDCGQLGMTSAASWLALCSHRAWLLPSWLHWWGSFNRDGKIPTSCWGKDGVSKRACWVRTPSEGVLLVLSLWRSCAARMFKATVVADSQRETSGSLSES